MRKAQRSARDQWWKKLFTVTSSVQKPMKYELLWTKSSLLLQKFCFSSQRCCIWAWLNIRALFWSSEMQVGADSVKLLSHPPGGLGWILDCLTIELSPVFGVFDQQFLSLYDSMHLFISVPWARLIHVDVLQKLNQSPDCTPAVSDSRGLKQRPLTSGQPTRVQTSAKPGEKTPSGKKDWQCFSGCKSNSWRKHSA